MGARAGVVADVFLVYAGARAEAGAGLVNMGAREGAGAGAGAGLEQTCFL